MVRLSCTLTHSFLPIGYLSVDAGSSAQLPTPPTIEIVHFPIHKAPFLLTSALLCSLLPPPGGYSPQDIDKPSRGGQVAGDDHFPKFHYVLAQPGFKAPGFGTVFSFWNNPYS